MTTVDPQEVIDRGLRLNPDRAASIAYALLDAERKIRDVQTLVEDAMTTGERWIPTDLLVRAALGGATVGDDLIESMKARAESAEAERDALQQQVANVQALADSLRWVRPDAPCVNSEACCGGPEACDAMQPSIKAVGREAIEAALGGPAAPTPEPTIAGYDGFAAPIMDHAQEPQPMPVETFVLNYVRCQYCGGNAGAPGHVCDEAGQAARSAAMDAAVKTMFSTPEPVERITDDRGDEQERGTDTDAEAAEACPHRCPCTSDDGCPHDCDCVTAQPQDGGA